MRWDLPLSELIGIGVKSRPLRGPHISVDYSTISAEELAQVCFEGGDESAWAEFVRRFHPLIARVVIRVARLWGAVSPQAIDDLIQDTYLKLCADRRNFLKNFKPTHADAVFGYIKVFTTNLVHDHFKAIYSEKRGGGVQPEPADDQTSNVSSTASLSNVRLIERNVLLGQIDNCLRDAEIGPNAVRDRRIFWLYFRVGLTASAISTLPSIELSTKGVESTILRMTRIVRQKLAKTGDPSGTGTLSEKGIRPAESF